MFLKVGRCKYLCDSVQFMLLFLTCKSWQNINWGKQLDVQQQACKMTMKTTIEQERGKCTRSFPDQMCMLKAIPRTQSRKITMA